MSAGPPTLAPRTLRSPDALRSSPPQARNPGLTLSYTLPVLPAGLTADGVKLLQSCVANGVRVDVVNLMTMDYGDSAAPGEPSFLEGGEARACPSQPRVGPALQGRAGCHELTRRRKANAMHTPHLPHPTSPPHPTSDPEGKMGDYAIQAAENTYKQALAVGLATKVGTRGARCTRGQRMGGMRRRRRHGLACCRAACGSATAAHHAHAPPSIHLRGALCRLPRRSAIPP